MKPWLTRTPEPPTLAQMTERGPLALCPYCSTYRTLIGGTALHADGREVVAAHDGIGGHMCTGTGLSMRELAVAHLVGDGVAQDVAAKMVTT